MSVPYFDAHCDTLTAVLEKGGTLWENPHQLDLTRLEGFAPRAQVFAVWGGRYEEKAALLRRELEKAPARAVLCRTAAELREAARAGRLAALLSVEGMEQLGCSLDRLREARERDGVVMVNLCWNRDNALCGAAMSGWRGPGRPAAAAPGGLTALGRAFVPAAQALGVAIDLSHASERAFWDTLEVARRPVLASHSNAAALCGAFPRNLTDAQFTALVRCGGGAGLNLCADFLAPDAGLDDAVRHVEHFLALGGEKALFLGGDLDGVDALPRGVSGVQDLGKLYEALLRRNHPEALVRDVFYHNLLEILSRTIG